MPKFERRKEHWGPSEADFDGVGIVDFIKLWVEERRSWEHIIFLLPACLPQEKHTKSSSPLWNLPVMFCLPREAMAHILIDSEVVGIKISSPLYKFSIYSCAGRNHCRYSLVLGMVTVPVNTGTFKNATLELPFHSRAAGQRQSPIRHGTCILSTSIHPGCV